MKTETKELIEEPPRWLCRVKTGTLSHKTGKRIVTAELVFGHESHPDKHGHTNITGAAHFKINGSTAEASVREMAGVLNQRKATPRDEVDECFADKAGWENVSRKHPQGVAIPLPPQDQDELAMKP